MGIRIPIVNRISDSLDSIPDSRAQDSRSHREIFPGLWIPPSSETQGQSDEGEKRREESFQARAQEPLGTDSHQASGQERCVTVLKTAVYQTIHIPLINWASNCP